MEAGTSKPQVLSATQALDNEVLKLEDLAMS